MSAVVIIIVVVVVTTQNNVNRIYFSWKYRLKSLYTGNLLSEAKWAFFCRFHGQPSVEKFGSLRLSLNLCWAAGAAAWCAFTIQWIGLIKKSFHCEWSENTQFWLLSYHCLDTIAHPTQRKSTTLNHCQRNFDRRRQNKNCLFSIAFRVRVGARKRMSARSYHMYGTRIRASDIHMPVSTFKCTRLRKLILTFEWKWQRRISKTAKLRGMKRDNDLKL